MEDLWALGVILYRLCAFEFPFKGKETAQVMHEVIYGLQKKIPEMYSKALATIVRKLLNKDPQKRPNIHKLIKYSLTVKSVKSFVSELKGVSN